MANIQSQLDRCYCNSSWLRLYQGASLRHLARTHSDHSPLLLHQPNHGNLPGEKPFKVLSAWYLHPHFPKLVRSIWTVPQEMIYSTLDKFRVAVRQWNHVQFGNIFYMKYRYLARLGGIQRRLAGTHSDFLSNLDHRLRLELADILRQEEAYWWDKSRV